MPLDKPSQAKPMQARSGRWKRETMALSQAKDDDQAIRQAYDRISLAVADNYSYAARYHRPTPSSDSGVVHAKLRFLTMHLADLPPRYPARERHDPSKHPCTAAR